MNFLITIFTFQALAIFFTLIRLLSKKIMVHVLRVSYSIFLLFSGFVKIIDPLGFSYKLEEYFQVFGMDFLLSHTLFLSIAVCLLEFFIAIFLLTGVYVKKTLYLNLFLMISFTFLTFYSAYFNAVTDCGCFGDFMKLEPWVSFQKDVFLLLVSFLLLFHQVYIKPILEFSNARRLFVSIIIFFILLSIPVYSLSHLPIIDFRAYKINADLIEGRKSCDQIGKPCLQEEIWYKVVDKQTGDTLNMLSKEWASKWKEFDKVPGYEDRVILDKGYSPPIKDFDIINPLILDQNMTDSILKMNKVILVISHDIEKTNIRAHNLVADFATDIVEDNNVSIYGLSSSSTEDIMSKLAISKLPFPYFLVDQTTLKTIIRANPGIILLEKGVVTNKWHWRDLPSDPSLLVN
tara:strand:+ start:111 stop:1322 length:1212 start_codon:yes stop_codon:yes gene_type:complete